ncbi:MAG: TauD/TfdA family dioxygenase [Pseudomonadota bacterium]|nr:TauD/TfdA family dioxygenase [Pseudomonadota bacterium]
MPGTDNIVIKGLSPALGARVEGVDFRSPINPKIVEQIHEAWMKYQVLVFPNQCVSDEQHVAVTRYFGEPEVFHQSIIKSKFVKEIFRVSNTDEAGNLMSPSDPIQQQLSSAKKWHTDSSYRLVPAMGSLLHGIEVSRTGGLTCFTNMYAVYEALPVNMRKLIDGKKCRHDFEHLSRITGARKPTDDERASMPAMWQPMVRKHPVTGRKSLYISPIYNDKIEDMNDDEAMSLINELAEFAGQDQFVYRHKWETDDILMWDNRCTMHLVTPHDPNERRVMHRTTIVGDGPVLAA